MKRFVAVLVVLPLVLTALLASPAEASKKKYKVKVSVATKVDAGSCLKVSGKVRGPGAQSAKVRIKVRKPGSSRFATVKRATVKKRGKYAACVELTTPGANQIRVKKPKSKARKAGVSAVQTVTAWAWLDLTKQKREDSWSEGVTVGPVSIAGRSYSPGMAFEGAGSYFNVAGKCDTFRAQIGLPAGVSAPMGLLTYRYVAPGEETELVVPASPGAAPKNVQIGLTGYQVFAFESDDVIAVVAPQAHCSVPALGAVPPSYTAIT